MAQSPIFYSAGGMLAKKGVPYTIADLPTFSPTITIDTLRIVEAPRIWRADLNRDGTQITNSSDNKPSYVKGSQRGVRILIQRTGAAFPAGGPNTPVLYKEGEEIALHADNTYLLFDDCVIEFGTAK